jgi:fumarylacetoacetate (FAA) hydrolase family protein
MDFTLQENDIVRITIDQVGTLTNPVRTGKASMSWLTPFTANARSRRPDGPVTDG